MTPAIEARSKLPEELLPALQAIKNIFDDSHRNLRWVTERACYAHLRTDISVAQEWALPFSELKLIVGPRTVQRFDIAMSDKSLAGIFLGYFDFFSAGFASQMPAILDDLLAIGANEPKLLPIEPIAWAKEQVRGWVESKLFLIQWWARRASDGRGLSALRRGPNHEAAPRPEQPFRSSVRVNKNWDDHETEFCTVQEWLSSPARYDEERRGNTQGIENVKLHGLEHLSALVDLEKDAGAELSSPAGRLHYHLMPFVDDIEAWKAPAFTAMKPFGNIPYKEFAAWNRLPIQDTREMITALCVRHRYALEEQIERAADIHTVKRLTSGAPVPKPAQAPTPPSTGEASLVAAAKPHPQSRSEKAKAMGLRDKKIMTEGHRLRKTGKSIAEAANEMAGKTEFGDATKGRIKKLIGGKMS